MHLRRLVARGYRNLADRGAADWQVVRDPPGFAVEIHIGEGAAATVGATYSARKKRITVDGAEVDRLADSVGHWLAVTFLPTDVGRRWKNQVKDVIPSVARDDILVQIDRPEAG